MVNGIDYGFSGEVKKIDVSRIRERPDSDSVVVVSNMGFLSSREVLNCKYVIFLLFNFFMFSYHQCVHNLIRKICKNVIS